MTSTKVKVILLALVSTALAEITVYDGRTFHPTVTFNDVAADFGRRLPDDGLSVRLVEANPIHGCQPLQKPPNHSHRVKFGALISRYGGCNFEEKVRNAQEANYTLAVVFDPKSNRLLSMAGSDDSLIPSVFIGRSDASIIRRKFVYSVDQSDFVVVTDEDEFNLKDYLLPFIIVCGITFFVMIIIVIYKCVQDHRRSRRHRLPRSALKKLPIIKFKPGDEVRYETCAVCLDDFVEGEKLRVLPCDHAYHSKCIDPWLLKTKRICPQCRKKVFPNSPEEGGSTDEEGASENERAPLLQRQRQPEPRPSTSRTRRGQLSRGAAATAGVAAGMAAVVASVGGRNSGRRRPLIEESDSEDSNDSNADDESHVESSEEGEDEASVPQVIVAAVETHPRPDEQEGEEEAEGEVHHLRGQEEESESQTGEVVA